MKKPKGVLIAMRAVDMQAAHPHTDYTHVCIKCGERVGLCPSSLRTLGSERIDMDLICSVCVVKKAPPRNAVMGFMPEAEKEYQEALDFTRKQKKQ